MGSPIGNWMRLPHQGLDMGTTHWELGTPISNWMGMAPIQDLNCILTAYAMGDMSLAVSCRRISLLN